MALWTPTIPPSVRLSRWRRVIPQIRQLAEGMKDLPELDLKKQSLSLRFRAKSGEPMAALLPEAFALVTEASRRSLGMVHFDVQLLGGMAMFHGAIAEMETGEGKTLTATLPMYLRALSGRGSMLATVNDYLAARDAELMGPVYNMLGMSIGVVQSQMSQPDRRKAYQADITYGTAKEYGFDFLRDRLLLRASGQALDSVPINRISDGHSFAGDQPVQRSAFFALIDEADSVLIDEARTPLIISALPGEAEDVAVACYHWAAATVDQFEEDTHYEYDHEKKTVELNIDGRLLVRSLPKPEEMNSVGLVDIYEYIERSVKVGREFERDRHYVIHEDEIVIVDEATGRLAEGRKWRSGIHQAIEARENVEISVDSGQAARVTVQDYFMRFHHLGGMTGTASSSGRELHSIYKMQVIPIPTNRKKIRQRLPDRVFGNGEEKWAAIVEEVRETHDAGRPVLIGTRSIERSELLSGLLAEAGLEHQVLNANRIAAEADIVSQAGQPGQIMVSTNMAGRGTDIKLEKTVHELGGLHVICTELHDSARIDRQLAGRCGRQGDPGTVRQYMALDDEILKDGLGPKKAKKLKAKGSNGRDGFERLCGLFVRAQDKVERRNYRGRKMLMHHEKQLRKMQTEIGQDPYLDTPD